MCFIDTCHLRNFASFQIFFPGLGNVLVNYWSQQYRHELFWLLELTSAVIKYWKAFKNSLTELVIRYFHTILTISWCFLSHLLFVVFVI